MKTKLVLFLIVCVLTIGAYFLGHQTTKQQIVEQKSEVRQLKDTLQHEKETNETLSKR
ncbi:TPA: hypothetical protein PI698_002853, partial [Staphylococcus aureus]|nr:hypothetical protein [Staphylococcus aureus]HDJ3046688.1 hypothetical protein [Staphylococcus aureus]